MSRRPPPWSGSDSQVPSRASSVRAAARSWRQNSEAASPSSCRERCRPRRPSQLERTLSLPDCLAAPLLQVVRSEPVHRASRKLGFGDKPKAISELFEIGGRRSACNSLPARSVAWGMGFTLLGGCDRARSCVCPRPGRSPNRSLGRSTATRVSLRLVSSGLGGGRVWPVLGSGRGFPRRPR